ncbi:MAG: CpsD/CapB family tyrosine-protein kinase [Gemmatimonadota bacterium]|jgi:capsular exopolysaccharide synthesis family protein|nr:hypothetical protein [Gemmatimonadota bacterium]MDP6460782.1 CpsD/CapB family tyrosine-protein kinase [Gemmatimonadota bacterium]MDP6529776.1 CpsD/CapB family tyrosine-protein kinase [Gemmatimonadota bacterium]MDP7031601.1 CpsD/CapB family tyrosine-protein kinase [Gemmatimonadota bacterium]
MPREDVRPDSIYDTFDPEAPETTEFRRIFTRIARHGEDEKLRSILFTSAERGEGKTTCASLFALVSCLHQGLRTVLVDGDLHRPQISGLFETPSSPGVREILLQRSPIEACLHDTRHDSLKVIPAGGGEVPPSEVLVPDRLAAMFGKLRLLFDLVVVDAPPLLPVSDPSVIAREVDGVALVVRAGRTQRDVAVRAQGILQAAGGNGIGVIVNNVDDVLPYYYGHAYYGYSRTAGERRSEKRRRGRSRKVKEEPMKDPTA